MIALWKYFASCHGISAKKCQLTSTKITRTSSHKYFCQLFFYLMSCNLFSVTIPYRKIFSFVGFRLNRQVRFTESFGSLVTSEAFKSFLFFFFDFLITFRRTVINWTCALEVTRETEFCWAPFSDRNAMEILFQVSFCLRERRKSSEKKLKEKQCWLRKSKRLAMPVI